MTQCFQFRATAETEEGHELINQATLALVSELTLLKGLKKKVGGGKKKKGK